MMNKLGQNKGALSIILFGLISVTIFSLLFIFTMRGAEQSYPDMSFDETEYESFAQTNDVINITEQMNSQFTSFNGSGTNVGDIINVVTTGGYNTIRIVGAAPGVFAQMLYAAAEQFGVPQVIVSMIISIVIGAIIVLFVLLVFRVYS